MEILLKDQEKNKMIYRKERQLWYNHRRSRFNPEMTTYFFVIVNTEDEIGRIEERIYDKFVSIAEEFGKFSGEVESTGFKFKVIPFDSPLAIPDSEIKRIYQGRDGKSKTLKDNNLHFKEDRDGLEKYVNNQLNYSLSF
ncbi:hypothetical protein CL621_02510 [archaeon]|nr:hypothetical protein [archaeon]